ncbi:MAG TPA: protein kinase [Kofleriaceae bacterium]|jgi:WD40 repeat protein
MISEDDTGSARPPAASARGDDEVAVDSGYETADDLGGDLGGELGSMESFLRAAASAPRDARPTAVGRTLDRYEVIAEIGRGGMGIVYEARDLKLDRIVALKCLPGELVGDEQRQRRFLREALVTAGLEHPGIVPVYDAGEHAGELYYAMKKVSGLPFLSLIARAHGLSERLALLPHVLAVSEAVAYAHRHAIVHRDLKPGNILVGELGETVVVDWGLAKRLSGRGEPAPGAPRTSQSTPSSPSRPADPASEPRTRAGDVLGTPGYMAPEQASGRPIDTRADVYALGAILGHVLTGEPPGTPPPAPVLAELADRAPDLLTLVTKAMAADPQQRYATAEELADELRRFLAGKLVGAHQYSPGALIRRWLGRHRAMVSVVASLIVVLAAVVVLGVRRIVDERDGANAARTAADAARGQAETRHRELLLIEARDDLDRDPTASLAWLKRYPHDAGSLPAERAIAADAWARGIASHVIRNPDPFTWVAAFPDGRRVAATTSRGDLVIVDGETGGRRVLHAEDGTRVTVQIAPDGRSAVTTDARGTVRLWDVAAGTSRKLEGTCLAMSTAFSPDGAFVLAWNVQGGACLWDAASGTRRALPADTLAAVFLPDRPALALGRERQLDVLDLATGQRTRQLALADRPVQLAASADGRWLAVTALDHVIVLDRRRGTQMTLRGPEGAGGVRLSGDGRWAAMCGRMSGTIWAFDLERGGPPRALAGQGCFRRGMVFAPDGTLITMTGGAAVTALDLVSGTQRTLAARQGAIIDLDVSANGKLLASATSDGVLRVYRLGEGEVRGFAGMTSPAPITASRALLLRNAADGKLAIGELDGTITPPISGARPLFWMQNGTVTGDGQRFGFPEADRSFVIYDRATAHRTRLTPYAAEQTFDVSDALSPDGSQLALAGSDCTIRIVDVRTGTTRTLGKHRDAVVAIGFSWNGRLLASAGRDGVLQLWDVATGAALRTFTGHSNFVFDAVFSRDDKHLLTASTDGTARVWDIASGHATVLDGHQAAMLSADFAPDGSAVVTAGSDGAVTRWDLATARPTVLRREPADLTFVRFSIDGTLVSTGGTRWVRIWDPAVPRIPDDPARFAAWLAQATTAEVDAQGQLASR